MDIHKSNYGHPQIDLWISINRLIMDIHKLIMDIHYSIMDIHKSIMDIHKSARIMDIHNINHGYP